MGKSPAHYNQCYCSCCVSDPLDQPVILSMLQDTERKYHQLPKLHTDKLFCEDVVSEKENELPS